MAYVSPVFPCIQAHPRNRQVCSKVRWTPKSLRKGLSRSRVVVHTQQGARLAEPIGNRALSSLRMSAEPSKPKVIISGAPGSGKGTQCEMIVERYGVVHISTGDMLRAAVEAGTDLGSRAKAYMEAGELVPDELVITMLKERMEKEDCRERGWLLDGFPRTAAQAKALDDAGITPSAVLLLNVERSVLTERILGRRLDPQTGKVYHLTFNPPSSEEVMDRLIQRSDDNEEKFGVRLEAYYKNARSIVLHYQEICKHIDGNRSKSQVFTDLVRAIDTSLASPVSHIGRREEAERNATIPSSLVGISGSDGMSVPEFVRRAEEAYQKGRLEVEDVNWSGQAQMESSSSDGLSRHDDVVTRLDLFVGDAVAIILFAWIGHAYHGSGYLDAAVFKTAAPFLVSWVLFSPLLGAYRRSATANYMAAFKSLTKSWAVCVPCGIALRGVLTEHIPPTIFTVITLAFTFVFLGAWRGLYVKIRGTETLEFRRGGLFEGLEMLTSLFRRW